MRTPTEYAWEVKTVFVEKRLRAPIVRKSGKVVEKTTVPITVCQLFLSGDFALTKLFRCVPVLNGIVLSWSICALTEPAKPLWPMLELCPNPKVGPSWKRWASMTAAEFSQWLSKALGAERASAVLTAKEFSDWLSKMLGPDKAVEALGKQNKDSLTIVCN